MGVDRGLAVWPLLRAFGAWWLRELSGSFPRAAAWLAAGSQTALLEATSDGSLRLTVPDRPAQEWAASFDSLTDEQAVDIRRAGGSLALELALPAAMVHRLVVQLPAAAGNQAEAVRYALLTASPITLDAIAFDWRELGPSVREGWVDIEVWLCRKLALERLVSRLRDLGCGVARAGVALPELPGRLAFTFHRDTEKTGLSEQRRRPLLLVSATLLFLVTVAATGAVALWQERGLRSQIDILSAKHLRLAPLAQRQMRVQAMDEAVAAARSALPTKVLDELARVLPKEAWLVQLQYQPGQLKLVGRSADTSAVLPALQRSRVLKDVRLDVVNAMQAVDGTATFELTATVVGAR
jgi:Tfp pilus assembly protein PilN